MSAGPSDELVTAGWRVVSAAACELGEHPVWDSRTASLVWVDVLAGAVHRRRTDDATSDHTSFSVGSVVGAVALRPDGGLVAAVDDVFLPLDEHGRPDGDPVPAPVASGCRFNDAAADPGGRFVAGTAALDGTSPIGALMRLDAGGAVEVLLEGVAESNGLGWSPDGTLLYYVDSGEPCVRRYEYDPDGRGLGPRLTDLADLRDAPGVPDGLTVDATGAVWVALWQGAELRRIEPDGRTSARVRVPVSRPTCPGFGGADLDLVYLTTAWEGMSTAERATEPMAGQVLVADLGVRGRPPYLVTVT